MPPRRLISLLAALALTAGALAAPASAAAGWLIPGGKDYDGRFTDVTGSWCEPYVSTCYATGLLNGVSPIRFNVSGELTIPQSFTIAARLHELLNGGDGQFPAAANGKPWYQPAVDYLRSHVTGGSGAAAVLLHDLEYAAVSQGKPITRVSFVRYLSAVLPSSALTPINNIDVVVDQTSDDILAFYRAGILTGYDKYGSFRGNESLTRAEAAALLARIIDPSLRRTFTPTTFDLCSDVLDVDPATVLYTTDTVSITARHFALALCSALDKVTTPRQSSLSAALAAAEKELRQALAVDALARQNGLTCTAKDLQDAYGPLPGGYRGVSTVGWRWDYTHRWLKSTLLSNVYVPRYGADPVGALPGDKVASNRLDADISQLAGTLTLSPTAVLDGLDLKAIYDRLADSPF